MHFYSYSLPILLAFLAVITPEQNLSGAKSRSQQRKLTIMTERAQEANNNLYQYIFDPESSGENSEDFMNQAKLAFSVPEHFRLITQRDDNTAIKYGDYIRIMHQESNFYLHSHDIPYYHENSSEQQQVTCYSNTDFAMTDRGACWWQILGPQGSDDETLAGQFVDPAKPIRLRAQSALRPENDENYINKITMLHSHGYAKWGHPSPVREEEIEAKQDRPKQEVSCCPDNNEEDNWLLMRPQGEDEDKRQFKLGSGFILKHVTSGKIMRSKEGVTFNVRAGKPSLRGIDEQQEVSCVDDEEHPLTTWRVALVAREIESEK